MSAFDKLMVAAALILISISLLNPGGLFVGLFLGIGLLAAVYGGRYLLQLEQSRRMGERAGNHGVRDRIAGNSGSDEGRWNR